MGVYIFETYGFKQVASFNTNSYNTCIFCQHHFECTAAVRYVLFDVLQVIEGSCRSEQGGGISLSVTVKQQRY
jgi:hypothetical protein